MSHIEVRKLKYSYGKVEAISDISFDIPRGAVFGFIGPNGAGKSTTIKIMATLLRPAAGAVRIGGFDTVESPTEVRKRIGYMPDFFGVYDDLNVRQYLHFFAAAYRIPRSKRPGLVDGVLQLTDLKEKLDAPVDALSRGMKQRLGVARVLLNDPEVVLLDEPASGLDPRARIEIRELLKELASMGKTILISSHILHELSQFCTRVGVIEAGQLVAEGDLEEIYKRLDLLRVVHIQLVGDTEEVLSRIAAVHGVERVERASDRLALHIRESELKVEDLLERVLAAGARVRMFQPEAMDMETAFMKLTEGKTA